MEQAIKVEAVKKFWDDNPLFTGEAAVDGEFFKKHDAAYYDDVLAGIDIERTFLFPKQDDYTLDLGCGVGFWTALFYKNEVKSIVAADLSEKSLQLAKQRVAGGAGRVTFAIQNAESLDYSDEAFGHCNCQGVIHHTPNTQTALSEICRVLKHGGTASVSVYYDNILIRNYDVLKYPMKWVFRFLGRDLGRGRKFHVPDSKKDLVRLYDGADNPLGKSYSKYEFVSMCKEAGFTHIDIGYFFFPGRFLIFPVPRILRKLLVAILPFMIVANCRK